MPRTSLLHWRSSNEYDAHFPRLPWKKKRQNSKGKERVPSNGFPLSSDDAAFKGDTHLSPEDVVAMDMDTPRGLGVSEAMDFAYTAPRTGEPGPSDWPGRPATPGTPAGTVDPKNLMKVQTQEMDDEDDEDEMEVDPRLTPNPELDASTLRLDSVPFMKTQIRVKKEKKQAALKRKSSDPPPDPEKRSATAKKEISVEEFDSMKPAERAKLNPKRVNSDSFYRGFSRWRNMGSEARANERSVLDRLMSKFTWPKSLKRSREVIDEPLSPRSAPLSDKPSDPKYRRRSFFSRSRSRSERPREPGASVMATNIDRSENEDTESEEEAHDLVGHDSHELRDCDSRRTSTDPLPSLPPPALSVRTTHGQPAHNTTSTTPASPNQPTPDSARPRLSVGRSTRGSEILSQAQAAGFEKMSSGKPVSEGGKGVEVEMYRTSSWGVDVLVPV